MTVFMTPVFLAEHAFAQIFDQGPFPQSCDECEVQFQQCLQDTKNTVQFCQAWLDACNTALMCNAVGGEIIPLDTTMVLLAGTQTTAAWMIPVIVSGIGIGIVIARKI